MNKLLLGFIFCIVVTEHSVVNAAKLNDITLADSTNIGTKALILNGMGVRLVYKWGVPVKVYVAGLYLEKKNNDSYVIVKNDEVKRLVMHFLRPVDRDVLLEAFNKGYEDGCFLACDKKGAQFKKFAEAVVSVRKNNEITLTFYKDKIDVESDGPNAKKQTILDGDLSRNMLALFINKEKPPGQDFRKGLLGL